MPATTQSNPIAKLPVAEWDRSLRELASLTSDLLPEARLSAVVELMLRGLVTCQSPVVTQMARRGPYRRGDLADVPAGVLLTNVRLDTAGIVRQVYADWRQRSHINLPRQSPVSQGI